MLVSPAMLGRPASPLMLCTALAMACSSTDATSDDDAVDTESADTTGASTGEIDTTSTTHTPEPDSSSTDPTNGTPPECTSDDHCDEATPFCGPGGTCQASCSGVLNANASCAGQDPTTPLCVDGECVECTSGNTSGCDDARPICNPTNECMACTEHHHCPDSACHLDGPRAGRCFDLVEVGQATDGQNLAQSIESLPFSGRLVIHLFPGDYELDSTLTVSDNQEVAIIGTGNLIKSNSGGPVWVGGEGILYLDNVILRNDEPWWDGLRCRGQSVWIDNSQIRDNHAGIDAGIGCHVHLRRSSVYSNEYLGITLGSQARLRCENSLIARNGFGANSGGALQLINAQLDFAYCTVAQNYSTNNTNDHSLACFNSSGIIRNSIFSSYEDSIYTENCDNLEFETSALDTSGFGESNVNVGTASSDWFVSAPNGNFRLSPTGVAEIGDIAIWQEGDPETDIDGNPRDTRGGYSFPGYHEPSP
jgi:hypothetical protein